MSTRCSYVVDVTPLPNASTHYEEPALRQVKLCDQDALVVRYQNGIIVEGYCENHALAKKMSLRPWPQSAWERYSASKFYLGMRGEDHDRE
jgi:hypothetical protein